jgi:mannose-1-phosphate guanylyltransferase
MLYAVIPAGGSGTRLWPLSRAGNPKFLHPLTGTAHTLLQATMERLAPFAPADHTYVVTGTAHAAAVARQLPALPSENVLIEPSPRDSCAAIGLAAAIIARRDPEAVMGSFAADHLVDDGERFVDVLHAAVDGARRGFLMTVGITPTRAETGYGYLQCGPVLDGGPATFIRSGGPANGPKAELLSVRRVEEFKEKPGPELAESYYRSGRYLWNASMFVWPVALFLGELARQQPELHAGLTEIAAAWGTADRDRVLGDVWPRLPKISVDVAVMEGAAAAGLVATVPGDFGWNDVGDFHTLGDVLSRDASGNVVIASADGATPDILLVDSKDVVVVPHSGRLVATLGMQDVIVVDTDDAVLVCRRDRAQEVKRLVDALKDRGDLHLT